MTIARDKSSCSLCLCGQKTPSLRKMQVVLSLSRVKSRERKVRATQGISLSNGKGFRNENLNYGLVQQKIYRSGLCRSKGENVR